MGPATEMPGKVAGGSGTLAAACAELLAQQRLADSEAVHEQQLEHDV
jgi:hypothetical protein